MEPGPLVRMLMEIVRSMATFLLVLAIVFIGFSAAFSVLFRGSWDESYYARHEQAPPFASVGESVFALFRMLLGDFDTEVFEVSMRERVCCVFRS